MRVALVWAADAPLRSITVRYERYVRGFRRLGWEPVTVCVPSAAEGYAEPVVVAPTAAALRDPEFYRSLGCEVGVVIAWLVLPDVVLAMKAALPWVVSVADSDGQIGARAHPRATFHRTVRQHATLGMRLRAAKYWAQQYLFGSDTDAEVLASATAADRIAMTSPPAAEHLSRFFRHHRRSDLVAKVAIAPYPVDEDFLIANVPSAADRANRVIAIGRWDDPQKDAGLLAAGIERAAQQLPDTEFVLIGRYGESAFAGLCRRVPKARYLGVQPPEEVAKLLRTSRVLLLSSRWESGPIVAFEALSVGATVVGPESVPACRWFAESSDATLFTRRSGSAVAAALLAEQKAWENNYRDPAATVARWRPLFDPANVCRRMLPPAGGAG